MSRKDYVAMASILKRYAESELICIRVHGMLVREIGNMFASDNARFENACKPDNTKDID